MSTDKNVTKIVDFRARKNMNESIDIETEIDPTFSSTEINLLKLMKSGSDLVHFNVTKKNIKLVFYDGSIERDLDFYVDENGDIGTQLITTKIK